MVVAGIGVVLGLIGASLALSMSADIDEVREQLKAKPNRIECVSPRALEDLSGRVSDAYSKASDAYSKASDAESKASDAESKASDAESKASDAEDAIRLHKLLGH